jgi:hypothetical protein
MATDPRRKAAEKSIDEDAKARADSVAASEQIMASQPTPTQREVDLAKLGVDVSEKEDDGSGPDPNEDDGVARKQVTPGAAPAKYETRDAKPKV